MRILSAAAVAIFLLADTSAHAQTSEVWGRSKGENAVEGPGIKVGEGSVLRPVVGLETGFISNVFYEDTESDAAGILRVIGEMAIASQGDDRNANETVEGDVDVNDGADPDLEYKLRAGAYYEEFLSGQSTVRAQRTLGLMGDLHGTLFPKRSIAFIFGDRLTRDVRPTNFESDGNLNRWINDLTLGLRWQPGGGALTGTLRYNNRLDYFESSESRFANRFQHKFSLRAAWQWAPFTQFYADTSFGLFSGLGGDSTKASSTPLRIVVGANTAITEPTQVKVFAGFGKGFYSGGAEFTGPLLGAEFSYRYSPLGRVRVGYTYTFEDSINAAFYRDHRLYASADHQLERVFGLEKPLLLEGKAAAYARGYRGIPMDIGAPDRNDIIFSVSGGAKLILHERYAVTSKYTFAVDSTSYTYSTGTGIDDPSFLRHELYLGAVAAF